MFWTSEASAMVVSSPAQSVRKAGVRDTRRLAPGAEGSGLEPTGVSSTAILEAPCTSMFVVSTPSSTMLVNCIRLLQTLYADPLNRLDLERDAG
jgi:hypothetical protein